MKVQHRIHKDGTISSAILGREGETAPPMINTLAGREASSKRIISVTKGSNGSLEATLEDGEKIRVDRDEELVQAWLIWSMTRS